MVRVGIRQHTRVVLCLVLLSFVAIRAASVSPYVCACHHGVPIRSVPWCECRCYDEYLLPACLYRAESRVPLDLWWQQRRPVSSNGADDVASCRLTDDAVQRSIAQAFGCDDSLITVRWATATASTYASTSHLSYVRVRVTVPGWMAQRLHADVAHNNTAGYATIARGIDCAPYPYTLHHVEDRTTAPPALPRYNGEWVRLYVSASDDGAWYSSLPSFGWAVGAVILLAAVLLVENVYMFNVEGNVGGGATVPLSRDHYRERLPRAERSKSVGSDEAPVGGAMRLPDGHQPSMRHSHPRGNGTAASLLNCDRRRRSAGRQRAGMVTEVEMETPWRPPRP